MGIINQYQKQSVKSKWGVEEIREEDGEVIVEMDLNIHPQYDNTALETRLEDVFGELCNARIFHLTNLHISTRYGEFIVEINADWIETYKDHFNTVTIDAILKKMYGQINVEREPVYYDWSGEISLDSSVALGWYRSQVVVQELLNMNVVDELVSMEELYENLSKRGGWSDGDIQRTLDYLEEEDVVRFAGSDGSLLEFTLSFERSAELVHH